MAPDVSEAANNASKVANVKELQNLVAGWSSEMTFYLNGRRKVLENPDPECTLLEWIRNEAGLTGTKLGCAEGGCGACTVVVGSWNPLSQHVEYLSVNACIAPLVSVDGKHLITVEGIGTSNNPHPAQERIAKMHGSQCGFCTPGFVMSLYATLRNNPNPTEHELQECYAGNLCRCTGYRPLLDAAISFAQQPVVNGCGKGADCCQNKKQANGSAQADGCQNSVNGHVNSINSNEIDMNQLKAYDASTEFIFPPALRRFEMQPLFFGNKRKRWLRPTTLDQLLQIKKAYPSAKLTGGSSEIQVEIKFKNLQYSISVYTGDIWELKYAFKEGNMLKFGGNITLSDMMKFLLSSKPTLTKHESQICDAMLNQLQYFAGPQIRNVATPAGNIATASPISDLNPVFVATDAVVQVAKEGSTEEISMPEFFIGYRSTKLAPDGIITSISVPIPRPNEYVRAYKQAKRKDDDIAIVNAAIRMLLNETHEIQEISIAYGGMGPTTMQAKKTCKLLVGKCFGESQTLETAFESLENEFNLPFGVPGGMAVFRKSLALSFFYRFWCDIASTVGLSTAEEKFDEAALDLDRPISVGWRDKDNPHQNKILGKDLPHLAALKQVTGEAQYTDDIPRYHNELYGCLVLSTHPHAKLKIVDPTPALDLPGVVAYADHNDLPSERANLWGAPNADEPFFAVDEVRTCGQPIGLIMAETALQAKAGAIAVRVEYEDLPRILTIEEAIAQESYFPVYRFIKRDPPTEGTFAECDHVLDGVIRMGGQEHFYLETQACVAVPKPEDGEMEIWSCTQNPTETQTIVSQVTGVAANKIVSRVKRLGGGFGGKETRSIQLAGILAVGAKKTRRPVRCMLNRDEDILTSGQRHPFLAHWKIGVMKDGKLKCLDADVFANGGWSQDLSGAVVERALTHIDNVYNIPHVHVRGRVAKTNTVSNTAFRGFGGPQGMFIIETILSEVADVINVPIDQIREMNLYHEGDRTHFNQVLIDYHVPELVDQIRGESSYAERRESVDAFNKSHKFKKRGLALVPTKFGISFTALFLNQAGALVHVYHDGSVLVAHGGTEMGQGLHTKMAMIAAYELDIPLENVHISETSTTTVANTSSTAGSVSSDLNGYAIKDACDQINERLAPYKEKLGPKATLSELAHAAYFDRVNLSANGFYKTPDIGYVWNVEPEEQTSEYPKPMFFYFTQGVAVAEVEIDTLTGDHTVLRADLKMV